MGAAATLTNLWQRIDSHPEQVVLALNLHVIFTDEIQLSILTDSKNREARGSILIHPDPNFPGNRLRVSRNPVEENVVFHEN